MAKCHFAISCCCVCNFTYNLEKMTLSVTLPLFIFTTSCKAFAVNLQRTIVKVVAILTVTKIGFSSSVVFYY